MNPEFKKKNNNNFYYLKELQWTNKAAKLNSLQQKLNSQNLQNSQLKLEQMNLIKEKSWNNRFVYSKIPNYDSTKDKNVLDPNLLKVPSCNCYYNAIKNNIINNQKSRRNIRGKNQSLNHKTIEKTYFNYSLRNIPNTKMLNHNSSCKEIFKNNKTNSIIFSQQINNTNNQDYNQDKITKLWNDLCILEPYRELFNLILGQLNDEKKNDIYQREFNELSELKNNIQILSCSIYYRIKTLEELNMLNDKLGIILKSKQILSNEVVLKNISKKIENLREYTINLCLAMKKVKEQINAGHPWGKFDLDDISDKYKFDKNYLIKMKDEMNVLREGYAKYFFNLNNDQTPFLINASESKDTDNNKIDPFMHKVPMNDELKESINQCTYIIYQELIGYQNNKIFQNNFRSISPLKKYKYTDIDIKIFKKQNISLNNTDKNTLKSNSIFIKSNGFSPSRTYFPDKNYLKNNNHRTFSGNETLRNFGKNQSFNNNDIIDNFSHNFKNQISSNYDGEFRNDINDQKEFSDYNKNNDELNRNEYNIINNNNNINNNSDDKKEGENELNENNVVIDKKFNHENNNNQENLEKENNSEEKKEDDINLNKEKASNIQKKEISNNNNINNYMINNEQINKNEMNEKQINNNIINNGHSIDDIKKNNKDKKESESIINKENNINMNMSEENKKEEKREIKDNNIKNSKYKEEVKKNNINEEENKKMFQKIKFINNSNKNGNNSSKKKNINLINEISPSLRSKKLKVITFTDNINIFSKDFYNYYYQLISTEIKDMFKIQEDICSNLFKGISPYIIVLHEEIFTDQDNWMNLRNSIFAVCTMNYKYKNNKLKIIINHISSSIAFNKEKNKYYLKDMHYIFDIMIKYIKNEFYFDEIVIEYDNNKANKELIDIFVNDLNFSIYFEDNEEEGKENKLLYINDSTNSKINDMIRQTASSYLGKTIFNIFNSLLITNNSKSSFITDTNRTNKTNTNNTLNKSYNDINIINNNDNLINIISMNYLMEIKTENNINILYNKLTKLDQLIKVFQKNKIKSSEIPLSIAYNRFDILSCVMNSTIINNCFNNSIFFNNYNTNNPISYLDKDKNIFYNFIKPEKTYVLYNDKYRIKFYHIINNNMSLFICNINNELLDYLNKDNIYTQMNEIYKGAIEENKKEILIDKIIWIPCFEIYNHYQCLSNNSAGIIHEYVKISNKAIKKKNKENLKLNTQMEEGIQMKIEPDISRDILLSNDFIFGIVNNSNLGNEKDNNEEDNEIKNIKDSDLPYIIFLSYINKNNFITNVKKKE